jgi:hypothetical protein
MAWKIALGVFVVLYVTRGFVYWLFFLGRISSVARHAGDHFLAFVQVVFFWPLEVKRKRVPLPDRCDRCGEPLEHAEVQEDGSVRMLCSCGRIRVIRG